MAAREGFQEPWPGLERRTRGGEEQQRRRELEEREQAVADAGLGQVADLRAVRGGDPDLQPHRRGGQPEGQRADDREGQPQRYAPEPTTTRVVELAQLRDRRRRRLDPVASAMATGNASSTAIVAGCPLVSDESDVGFGRVDPPTSTATATATNARVISAKIARPSDQTRSAPRRAAAVRVRAGSAPTRDRERNRSRRRAGRHADGDGQDEVDDQRADRHERPPLPNALPAAAAARRPRGTGTSWW